MRELLCNLPQGKPIHYLPEVEIVNTVKIVSGPYKSNFITEGVQAFLDFLHSFLGSKFPVIDLGSKNLKKEIIHFPVPLIYPFHVAAAMKLCEETLCRHSLRLKDETKRQRELHKAMHRAAMCQHMVNFGYYVGLRESEFTGLRIRDVICGADGLIICVRESKTNNGKRNIPMFAFFPDVYRSDFESYYESRLLEASSGDDWLFPDYNKKRLNAGYMAGRIKAVFKQIGILNMVFHDLRHGFASFSFLRLFHAFHPELFPEGLSIRKHILFQEPYTTRLKSLIIGQNHKIGQVYINHGMAALSILIGHGGPVITLEEYIHTADWLFFLISAGFEGFRVLLTAIQAENLLQVSNWSLPQDFKGRGDKKVLLAEIVKHQKACLFKSVPESR